MSESQVYEQWRDISTDLTECYEMITSIARGVVSRPRNQVSDYSAYVELGGRSQWARLRFIDMQGAKDWCERALDNLKEA
jgi:hypothetical protein